MVGITELSGSSASLISADEVASKRETGTMEGKKQQEQPTMPSVDEAACRIQRMLAAEQVLLKRDDHALLASSSTQSSSPNSVWREKVAQWCYDVCDRLGENRTCVYVAMNALDRYNAYFVQSRKARMNERTYEVSSMTALFLAVRISGSTGRDFTIQDLLCMSRGGVTSLDITTVGTDMIRVLDWDHRVVAPLDFVRAYLEFLPSPPPAASSSVTRSDESILNSASYLVELAVCDSLLASSKSSDIALAAVLNSMLADAGPRTQDFVIAIRAVTDTDPETAEITSLRRRLHRLYSFSVDNNAATSSAPAIIEEDEGETTTMEICPNIQSSAAVRTVSEGSICPAVVIE